MDKLVGIQGLLWKDKGREAGRDGDEQEGSEGGGD